jgi:NADPH:quinone reductase-like Zn-dependent oxidoreductase
MRAVVLHNTGGPEALRVEEIDAPEPGEGEVLIAVRAASVNPIDWKFRRGLIPKELPAVLGSDVSGTVVSSRAEGFGEGDEVFGMAASGAYAQLARARAAALARRPRGVSHEQAAAIPVAGLTAWQTLFDVGGLARDQRALVNGAAGGVGHFAVQLARHAGASVTGTGSTRNRDFVLGLGAAEYVDYTSADVATAVHDVDLALDAVGGERSAALVEAVREGGMLVLIAGAPPEEAARARGVRTQLHITSPNADQLARIAELVAQKEVRVEISHSLPLSEASRAHELSESGHTRGKIVLTM